MPSGHSVTLVFVLKASGHPVTLTVKKDQLYSIHYHVTVICK
jgi:hypothetical protein